MKRQKFDEKIGWHVMDRGTRRLELFRDAEDYLKFLSILKYAIRESGCILWAYTLMSNHYHLVVFATSSELTDCMHRLNQMYSAYHNERYGLTGTAFEGPYRAYPQPSPLLLLRTLAYVFFNPFAAGFKGSLQDYPWSCFKCYAGLPGSPLEVDPSLIMSRAGSDLKAAWEFFWKAIAREGNRLNTKPEGYVPMADIHAEQFEWLLEYARERREEFRDLRATVVAMHWGRQAGVAPRAMAKVLGEKDSSKVRRELCQLSKRIKKDPDLGRRLRLP